MCAMTITPRFNPVCKCAGLSAVTADARDAAEQSGLGADSDATRGLIQVRATWPHSAISAFSMLHT